MVYMSGAKAARNQASICNRTNTCGGMKKSGLSSQIGLFLSSNPQLIRGVHVQPLICRPNFTIQTQTYGYRAVHGGNMG